MARPNKDVDWVAVEGVYRAGSESVRAIAERHGVTEAAIRQRAKKYGWTRDAAGTKREIVRAHFAGVTSQITSQEIVRSIEDAARQDIEDNERGVRIARLALMSLERAVETVVEPKEIKVIIEATSSAIDTIRRIRGLEDPVPSVNDATSDEKTSEVAAKIRAQLGEPAS
jgi:hypothetical protein